MSDFQVRPGTVEEALAVEALVPEFGEPLSVERYLQRIGTAPALVLVAEAAGELVGYKVGYQSGRDVFYSWLGGVVPSWRRRGVATALRLEQEAWVRSRGYARLEVRSRNRFPAMLVLLVSAGYQVVAVEGSGEEAKILFSLPLSP